MKHIQQPTEFACAQSCAAMLLDHDDASIVMRDLPPRRTGTKHKALLAYLRDQRIVVDDRFTSARGKAFPNLALVRITWPDRVGHLVVLCHGWWHDPLLPQPFQGTPPPDLSWSSGGRITSYCEVAR
jgi:hypothetical protein